MTARIIFILLGSLSLLLGVGGIFLPGLPATPFIILTAGFYARSSPYLYNKIVSGKLTGRYFKNKSVRRKKLLIISAMIFMWAMILINVLLVFSDLKIRLILIAAGITGSVFKIGYLNKSRKENFNSENNEYPDN